MWLLFAMACAPSTPLGATPELQAATTPPSTIPEAEPTPNAEAPSEAPLPAASPGSLSLPGSLVGLYDIALGPAGQLIVDPAMPVRRDREVRSGGFSAEDTAKGGKEIRLDDGPITKLAWSQQTLGGMVLDADARRRLADAGYDILAVADDLDHTTQFAFSLDPDQRGMVGICTEVTMVDFATPSRPVVVRKPVIYAYPLEPTLLTVSVDVDGELTTVHPPLANGVWRVMAHPSGALTVGDRVHDYLFWEATGPDFRPDPAAAFSVARDQLPAFLEGICDTFALTDSECGDFVTYWLPEMNAYPHVTVSFPLAAYERYARLNIHPRPDSVIRLFMVFEGTQRPQVTVPPQLVQQRRGGFTVVEWGGVEAESERR
jgi:hypothetical protein